MMFTGIMIVLFGAVLVIVAISVAVSLSNISQRLKYFNTLFYDKYNRDLYNETKQKGGKQ